MSPRTEAANQQIREERQRNILDAALKLFAIKGLSATKISDIAVEANLSYGLIYHYFNTKDQIFTELVKEAMKISINVFKQGSKLPVGPLEKIKIITEKIIEDGYSGRGVYYFLLIIEAANSDIVPAEVKKFRERRKGIYHHLLTPIIIEGQKIGEIIEEEPVRLATAYFALIKGLALLYPRINLAKELPTAEIVLNLFKKKKD